MLGAGDLPMAPWIRLWVIQGLILLTIGILCCLVVAAVISIPGCRWLAAPLVVMVFVSLRVLGTLMSE